MPAQGAAPDERSEAGAKPWVVAKGRGESLKGRDKLCNSGHFETGAGAGLFHPFRVPDLPIVIHPQERTFTLVSLPDQLAQFYACGHRLAGRSPIPRLEQPTYGNYFGQAWRPGIRAPFICCGESRKTSGGSPPFTLKHHDHDKKVLPVQARDR